MPLYDYRCKECQKTTEVRHGFGETFQGVCPACGGAMARVFNAAGIVFKGSGFYVNDSRAAASKAGQSTSKPADAPAPAVDGAAAASTEKTAAASTSEASTPAAGDGSAKKSDTAA